MCLLLKLFLQFTVLPTLTGSAWPLLRLPLGLSFLWSRGSAGSSLVGHAVEYLDSEETPMTMENSDTVMPTYRNPGRLAMADNTEAGTDVLWRDPNGYGMWLYLCRRNWRGESLRGCLQRVYRCRRSKWCCLWWCEGLRRHRDVRRHCKWWWITGRHKSWAFISVQHFTWFHNFLLDSGKKREMQLILSTRWGWTEFNLAAKIPSLFSTNLIKTPALRWELDQDKSPRNSFETFHSF